MLKLSSNSHLRQCSHLATAAIAKTNAVTLNRTIANPTDARAAAAATFAVLLSTPF
jgi:hypothetical protein